MKTLLLFSGGLDSTALLFWKKPDLALLIDYGQKAFKGELRATKQICEIAKVPLKVINAKIESQTLNDFYYYNSQNLPSSEWFPFRNQYIITLASIYSFSHGYNVIYLGTVKSDGLYKDGQKSFYNMLHKLISFQEGKIKIKCPAINLTTQQLIINSSLTLDVIAWCHSCTNSDLACGRCPSCKKHQEVMVSMGYNSF